MNYSVRIRRKSCITSFSPDTLHRAWEFYEKAKHLSYLEASGIGAGYKEPWYEKNLPDWEKNFLLWIYGNG